MVESGIKELDEYVEAIISGDIEACKWVRLAVERHVRDMGRQGTDDFPYYFEPKACLHYVNFFRNHLQHFDGIHAGKPIYFEPWQYFVWGTPFGWLKKEKLQDMHIRRFREVIIIIPKKQGKSIVVAGTMLYMIDFDGWQGAQVYALARNRSHAEKLGYRDAEIMVEQSEELKKRFKTNKGAAHRGVYCDDMRSFIQPLTSKPESTDGLKVHMAANDEIKDWTDFEIYDVIKQGTAANPNALIANITTAGADMSSLGYEREDYAKKVIEGSITDEQTFAVIYTIDQSDRDKLEKALSKKDPYPDIEPIIKKANPNYNISVGKDYYASEVASAKTSSRNKNRFLTKHLNVWINAMDHYYNMEEWRKCRNEKYNDWKEVFKGKPCYVFIDLQSKKDICPMYALFPDGKTKAGKPKYATFGINFLPEYVVSEKLVGKRSEYNAWASSGNFVLTPGKTTDYDYVREELRQWKKLFNIKAVGFDDWGPQVFAEQIERMGLKVLIIKQITKHLSDPMKTIDAWTLDHRITHNADPVLFWAMSNVVAKEDANENVFPRKEHTDNKIDPAVALINLVAMELEDPLPLTSKRRVPKVWGL